MITTQLLCSVLPLIIGPVPLPVPEAEPVPVAIDRAEVELLRAAIPGRTIIVDWHGTWDYPTIQGALDAATNGDTIIVLPSTGSPAGAYVENVIFPARAITLRSINPADPALVAATIIDGNAAGTVVTFEEGTPPEAIIEGFTIRNGHEGLGLSLSSPTIKGNTVVSSTGWGLAMYESSATITSNIIAGNAGGGLHTCYELPTITGNTIKNNAGPGLSILHGSPLIANNTITGNGSSSGTGGGVIVDGGLPVIVGNTIADNIARAGGGLSLNGCRPTIANNIIADNFAAQYGGGLGVFTCWSANIANNRITGNRADSHGGGICLQTNPDVITIANNVIAGNGARAHSGGLALFDSAATIANTIVAFNSSGILWGGGHSGVPSLRHNCVYGNSGSDYRGLADPTGTEGNISLDPLFVQNPNAGSDGLWATADDVPGDLHLSADSPCINAGDNAYAAGEADLDGNPRLVGCLVDMGAYEYQEVIPLPADFDENCAVDHDDYVILKICLQFSGPGREPPFQECLAVFDFDADADTDLADFAVFARSFGNP